ncbi:uncharacterized protein [Ptychodera flava]|uniref:uncharacterized protein isoform X1 n=1 Tax=Ptychodera flava TaxID=63121 RepID=UPI003969F3C9
MMRLDVTLGEFLTVMTVLVCVPVYGEEWSWSRPCVIERGKCSTQMTDAGMKCNIAESGKGSQCERFEPVRWTEIPDKPTDFKARLDTDTVVTANNVTENHIMANLSWTIDTFGNHPQGFHVLLRGLTNHGEYMYDYFHEEWCFTINMTGFDYKNVYSRYLTFQFDCFRPLAPYCEYQLVVRTLPVTEEVSPDGKTGPTSTQASLRFTTPPCDDDRISRTTQCLLKEKASHWQPTYLIPSSPAYNKIKVKFDLPPQRYGLTSYGISIYRYNRESIGFPCSKFVDDAPEVFQNDTNVQISNISIDGSIVSSLEYTFVRNFPAGNYCMKLHPGPDDRCWSPTGSFCRTSVTGEFEVKDPDPCFSDPCGINHRCLPLNKTHYSCNCTERYYFDDVTCKEDHCYSNPCRHGECIRTDSSYLCNCSSEHTFHGGVCVPQVSVSDPLKIASVTLGSIFAFVLAGLASWCYWRQSATLPILIPDRKTTADKASNDIEDKILKAHVSIEVVHTDGDSDSDSCNDDKITREIEENIVVKGRLRITSDDNLNKKYSIDIVELKIGCIILLLNVKNKPGLQKFYTDSKSGELDKILHQLLINDEIKKMAKGRQIRVSVTITEDEYKRISNDFDSEHGTSVTVDPDEVSISATECAQDPQPVDVKQTQNAHAQTSVDKSKSTVSVPRSFTGLKPVQSLEVLKSTSDSVHIRWSPPEGTSEHTGYRISCVQTTGKKKIPSVSEVMSPSVQFWKRGGLIRGQYRVSVSVLYGNGTGNGGGEILSFAKYIDVKVGQSKHRRISKIPTKARNRTKLATQSRFVSYVKAEPESVKEDPGFQDEHHDEPADGKTIDPGTCHSCIGNGGERDKDHMDGEKDSAPSISQSQENKGGASNTNGRKLSFRRGSVRRANSIRIQPRRRCYAISGAWAKTRRGPIKPEKDDSCGGTAETSGAAKSDVDVEIEIRDGKDQNISDVQVYQTSLCSRDDDQSEASGASNKPYHAVQRSDSGVFDQPEGEPIDEASEEEGDTYL